MRRGNYIQPETKVKEEVLDSTEVVSLFNEIDHFAPLLKANWYEHEVQYWTTRQVHKIH